MEAKVKEEVPDKDYTQLNTERRKTAPVAPAGKDRRSPEQEESRSSPAPLGTPAHTAGPPSPTQHNNGTTGVSPAESLSPPPGAGAGAGEGAARAGGPLVRLRRFLSALHHFAADVGADAGDRTRQLIHNLVAGTLNIEEFQTGVQESTNYPLRASVPGFLRALLPLTQRDLHARARRVKQTPLQYIRANEHLILESGGDGGDIFAPQPSAATDPGAKRRASDPFYEAAQTNGSHDDFPPPKRPHLWNPSPFLYPLPSNASLFDYPHYHGYHPPSEPAFDRRDGGITVRDVSSMNAPFAEPRSSSSGLLKTDDEWKNINTMLNCILSMVEKTKRALAILQQRGVEPTENTDIKRVAHEIMAAAVRQTEERVGEVRRRAEDAVNQVKRQALLELQRAVGAVSGGDKPLEGGATPHPAPLAPPAPPAPDLSPNASGQQNCCWNCGRKALETCSGCGAARYCGAFCQHKDWENHHQVCSGRDQKPTALLRSSPPAAALPKTLARAATPIATTNTNNPNPTDQNRLSLTSLNTAERMLTSDRLGTERIALSLSSAANLTSAQSLLSGVAGKK